MFKGSKQ